ncbi:MAG: hypothetical protein WDO16_06315 [Bacteroidota bacterium]
MIESVIVSFPFQLKLQSDRIGNFRVYMLGGVKGDIDLASNARAKKAEDLVRSKNMTTALNWVSASISSSKALSFHRK